MASGWNRWAAVERLADDRDGLMALGWAYQSFDGTEVARVQRARSITFSIC
jgi:hypothetical protein